MKEQEAENQAVSKEGQEIQVREENPFWGRQEGVEGNS